MLLTYVPSRTVLQTAEICRNRRHLTDKTVDLASRMSTWEGKPHTYDVTPLNKYRADEVNTAMRSVINHINSLLPTGCSVWNAVIYWKVNTDSKLILLWCSEMQIRNSFDVVDENDHAATLGLCGRRTVFLCSRNARFELVHGGT